MESQSFTDKIGFGKGLYTEIAHAEIAAIGDALAGGKNVAFNKYGQIRSWRGISRRHGAAGKLLHLVDGKIATSDTGSILIGPGKSLWYVGSGAVKFDNPATTIGTASSLLQIYTKDAQSFQAGLPAPPAPSLSVATDSGGAQVVGGMSSTRVASLSRIRSATGAESAESPASAALQIVNGKYRVTFPRALDEVGQDAWGLFWSRNGIYDVRYRLRIVEEAELAVSNGGVVGDAAGTGTDTVFGATSAGAVHARMLGVSLASAGASPPVLRGTKSYVHQRVTSATLMQPDGTVTDDQLLVALFIQQKHTITGRVTNVATAAPFTITGAWSDGGFLAPGSEQIEVEIVSATHFRWKRASDVAFSSNQLITTTPAALGATGLSIKFATATVPAETALDYYFVQPFALTPPSGWTFNALQASSADEWAYALFSKRVGVGESSSHTWTASAAVTIKADVLAYSGTASSGTLAQTVAGQTTAATTHTVTFAPAPSTAHRVVFFIGTTTDTTITATAPLTLQIQPGEVLRVLDFDFTDGDLLFGDVAPSVAYEPPPAATHAVQMGAVLVLLGTDDGTGITPSLPGQWEQYAVLKTTFLDPAEPIIRVDQRKISRDVFIWTENSVQTLMYNRADDNEPIIPDQIQGARGIGNPNGAAVGENVAYAFRDGVAYRIVDGRGVDTSFSDAVANLLREWDDRQVVVGYDPRARVAVYAQGDKLLAFYETLGAWTTLQYVTNFLDWPDASGARIASAVTAGGHLVLSIGSDALGYRQFEYDCGLGTNWEALSIERAGGSVGFPKTINTYQFTANLNARQKLNFQYRRDVEERDADFLGTSANAYVLGAEVIDRNTLLASNEMAFEWAVRTGASGAYILADVANLSPYGGASAVLHDAASALLALRITAGSAQGWRQGAAVGAAVGVQVGDVLQLAKRTTGWQWSVIRNSSVISTLGFGALSVSPVTMGLKIQLDNAGRLHGGYVERLNAAGQVRWRRNFGAQALKAKSFPAAGQRHYDYESLNLRNCASYQVEIAGTGAGQQVSHVLLEGTVIPQRRL